jgi:ParB family transcriptional regulator, chromosome partitioning protein
MTHKSGLGRGLDALIPTGESEIPQGGINQIPLDRISPNPRQPRSRFDEDELDELAASIREHGVIQPLLVTHGANLDEFTLIAGERRLLAARKAGLESVPAIIRDATEQQLVEWALIENVQRADLGPLETAEAFRQLSEDFNLSHDEIARRVGKSRVAVTNTLRLLKLPASVLQALMDGLISEGHARVLLALPTVQAQNAALQTITQRGLNVRQAEELVRKLTGQKPAQTGKPALPPEISALEERMRDYLGTKVNLTRSRKGGTLVIHYYSDEELTSLVDRILRDGL